VVRVLEEDALTGVGEAGGGVGGLRNRALAHQGCSRIFSRGNLLRGLTTRILEMSSFASGEVEGGNWKMPPIWLLMFLKGKHPESMAKRTTPILQMSVRRPS